MNGYFSGFLTFVVGIIFWMLIFAVLMRLILQMVRADFYNPVSQFVVTITNPMLKPLRRMIPGVFGIDMAAVVLLFALQGLELVLTHLIRGVGLHGFMIIPEIVGSLLMRITQFYMFSIFVMIIIGWINPMMRHPVTSLLSQINEPLLGPARRILPPLNGIDLSPILIFIAIAAVMYLIAAPLIDLPHRVF